MLIERRLRTSRLVFGNRIGRRAIRNSGVGQIQRAGPDFRLSETEIVGQRLLRYDTPRGRELDVGFVLEGLEKDPGSR